MLEDVRTEDEEMIDVEGDGENGKGQQDASVILVTELYRTPRQRMLEMTNVPLDKQRALTWMKVYVKEMYLMCEEIVRAQKALKELYELYHPNVTLKIDYLDEWETEGRKQVVSLIDEWVYHYCQVRRSKDGEHVKNAVLLSQDQMATQQAEQEGKSPFDQLRDQ